MGPRSASGQSRRMRDGAQQPHRNRSWCQREETGRHNAQSRVAVPKVNGSACAGITYCSFKIVDAPVPLRPIDPEDPDRHQEGLFIC